MIQWEKIWARATAGFPLGKSSIHGPQHWRQVENNGLMLARQNGADIEIVRLFAALHDSKRCNENTDPQHGPRGAEFAATLRGELFELEDERFQILHEAIANH